MTASRLRSRDERGNGTVFLLGMVPTVLLCAGLIFDGGSALNARMRLADDVEQAARAGAQQIDVERLRDEGEVMIDVARAEASARAHIASFGYTDVVVQVDGDEVSVSASDQVRTKFLSLAGINTYDVAASATSQAVTR